MFLREEQDLVQAGDNLRMMSDESDVSYGAEATVSVKYAKL